MVKKQMEYRKPFLKDFRHRKLPSNIIRVEVFTKMSMPDSFYASPFSRHFRVLTYIANWTIDPKSEQRVKWYAMYKVVMNIIEFVSISSLLTDLYMVFGNFKETTWNLCVSTLITGTVTKHFQIYPKNKLLNGLRKKFHDDMLSRTEEEYQDVHDLAVRELKLLELAFYGMASISIPVWLATRYVSRFWGDPQFPLPMRFPFDVNRDDETEYHAMFFFLALAGLLGLFLAIETELAMFTILVQLSREYNVLMQDIPKLNYVYNNNEVNPVLRKMKTKTLIKQFSKRQQELIHYTEVFEECYSQAILLQVFVVTLLVVASLMQVLLLSGGPTGEAIFQLGYSSILLFDVFFLCLFATKITSQCNKVGEVAYDCLWYKMENDIQKDIRMIIMRSQKPGPITGGKIMVLDLHTFMHMMRNIYSCLQLFRELKAKQID